MRFTPTSTGPKTARIRVAHNAPGDPLSLVVRGTGVEHATNGLTADSGPSGIGPAGKPAAAADGVASDRPATAIFTHLLPNFPNPFNAETAITYDLDVAGDIRLAIYNLTGQLTRVLFQGGRQPGRYSVVWDGRDESDRPVASGVYFCRLEAAEGLVQTRRMLLLK